VAVELTSPAFALGGRIPRRHTCDGDNVSPPLAWSRLPEGTTSVAIVMDDPDAPGVTFTHWTAWGVEPSAGGLEEGARPPVEGANDFGSVGYRGPCPPRRHGDHRYVFRLYALAAPLALGADATRKELDRAVRGATVLGIGELVGLYGR
jgi:Raf kinase inhibitor-like YbhB/YbcL family protein